MALVHYMQTNFTGGQISPRLYGRVDLDRYDNGAEIILNKIVHPHGGATKRSGTVFVEEVKDSTDTARIFPFQFSRVQSYILEFGDQYFRIYLNHGQLVSGTPVEVSTPYSASDLKQLTYTQSYDTLYLFHPDYSPRKVLRSGATSWSMSEHTFTDGPYLSVGQKNNGSISSSLTLTSAAATGSGVTLTASSALFESTDVGRHVRLKVGSNDWGWGIIASYVSSTQVTWNIKSTVSSTSATSKWRLGLFSDTTGWPRAGTFFEQRFCMAGATEFPNTVAMSEVGDFETFKPSDLDDTVPETSGVTYTIDTDQANPILWMKSKKRLLVGTSNEEFTIWSGETSASVGPNSIRIDSDTSYGSAENLVPIKVGKEILFINRTNRKLYATGYDFAIDGFEADDLTLLAEDISIESLEEVVYAQNPDNLIWGRLANGDLVSLTYLKKQDVVAWSEHVLGGSFSSGNPVVESIATIPAPDGTYDELWLVVKRTVDGNTVRYIEYLEKTFDEDITIENSRFLDCLITYSGASTDTLTGLSHLNGETVTVVSEGVNLGEYTVASDQITLTREVTECYVGFSYTSRLRTLALEAGANRGVAQGQLSRSHEVVVRFNRTLGATLGYNASGTMEKIFQRKATDPMGSMPALFTGDKKVKFPKGHDIGMHVFIEQKDPLPCTVLSIMPDISVSEPGS